MIDGQKCAAFMYASFLTLLRTIMTTKLMLKQYQSCVPHYRPVKKKIVLIDVYNQSKFNPKLSNLRYVGNISHTRN